MDFEFIPITLESQTYTQQDNSLLNPSETNSLFLPTSYIEFHTLDSSTINSSDYSFSGYIPLGENIVNGVKTYSEIVIDFDYLNEYFNDNIVPSNILFNFLNKEIGSQIEPLFIKEISSDRTEIRLDSTSLDGLSIVEQTNNFIQKREDSFTFLDFYINFGENKLFISNNVILDSDDINNPTVLIKLYDSLPNDYDINDQLWVVTSIFSPQSYEVNLIETPTPINDTTPIQGPNFNIDLKDQVNNSTLELSYSDLLNSPLSSSQNQINSLLEEKEIEINIDYTNFSDFVHFSSVKTRLENFYYKVSLIEQYSSSIAIIDSEITGSTSSSLAITDSRTILENKISDIITNFDGYDYYLYYESSSWAWPKTTSEPPYLLATTGSTEVLDWFGSTNEYSPLYGGIILSASNFDMGNKDNLLLSIPEYLREDSNNAPYELFVDMVAQHYDNIWIYYKDVTQKYNNDNRLEFGISKDLVSDAIRDFGIKLYQNNFSNEDLYTAFLGLTPDGALFPFPNITGSLPTPTGFEYVDTLISASNDYIPLDDVNKSLYKRIYHNLPYLLKAKGTIPGLRALITSYGIPDTILRISEFGGKDKVNANDWDYYYNKFNYKFDTEGTNFISSSWGVNSNWGAINNVPGAVEFRFKAEEFPPTNLSQSIWITETTELSLQYTGSGLTSGSYSGSIIDPYYQYANLTFYPSSSDLTISASVYLPFFNGEWWSILVNSGSGGFELFAKNKIYNGNDGTSLGFQSSSSITSPYDGWINATTSYFGSSSLFSSFSGSFQEIRYYKDALDEDTFNDYVMNPLSIEGNTINSSPSELLFRASLGGELDTITSSSIHPKVTGSWATTSSFTSDSNYYFNTTPTYSPNTEYFFLDQPIAGIKNRITDKIRVEDNVLPSGSTLSPFRRLAQTTEASASYTPNINLLEVAFSPQNEINDDIIGQLGYFNIGDYIGDPSERFSNTSYPSLDNLRNDYFEKYTKNYNLFDFIRLIKFFDNSLFKMIKDFIPARTSLSSGIVVKQHLLERNKYPQPQMEWEDVTYTGSIEIGEFSGGTGGSFEIFNGVNTSPYGPNGTGPENIFDITQSWDETFTTPLGEATVLHDSQEEFYDGEFSGSHIIVSTQDLNADCESFKKVNPQGVDYHGVRMYSGSDYNFSSFIDPNNYPTDGYISIWYQKDSISPLPPPNPTE